VYPYNVVFILSLALDAKKVANTNWTTWQEAQANAKRKNQPKKIMDTTRKDSSQITGQLFKGFSQYFHAVTELWCHLSWRNGSYDKIQQHYLPRTIDILYTKYCDSNALELSNKCEPCMMYITARRWWIIRI